MNRRSFVKTAAASAIAAGFPTILPSRVFGANAPSNRIHMAGIGMGGQGMANLENLLMPGVQWVGVCDCDRKRVLRAKRRIDKHHGNTDCVAYHDMRDLFARNDIDAVLIATPDHWHAWPAIQAAKKRIDIFGEKPIAHDFREGRAIANAVKANDCIWQTGSWQRSTPNFMRAVELVRNGRLGEIKHVEIGLPNGDSGPINNIESVPAELDWDLWLGPAPWQPYRGIAHWNWRWVLDWGGGQLNDWIGHHCDIALWALGLDHTGPVEIEGEGVFPKEGIYDAPSSYRVECKFENGLTMTIANADQLEKGMGTRFIGEAGKWLWVSRGGQESNPAGLWDQPLTASDERVDRGMSHWEDFIHSVKNRTQAIAPAEPAHRAFSVGYLGLLSMQLGRPLKWDPHNEVIVGDEIANRMLGRTPREPWSLI